MLRKAVSEITLTLLFIGILTFAFNIQPVYKKPALATIYETSQQCASFNQSHIVEAGMWLDPETVDPVWAYDSASCELIFNVYEPLIFYAVNRSASPAQAGKVDQFVPYLATNWTISPDGKTYTFKIREGVKFHNGETLTTEDIEYSFERAMVQDRSGGPTWMIYEPLMGCQSANLSDSNWHSKIENAVQYNETHVWFNLVEPYAPFLQILCQPWSSIVNKKFCVEHGDWPANETVGKWFWPGGEWTEYHNPDTSPLDTGGDWVCGTGPYKLDYWTHEMEYSLVIFDDYWEGWPAPGCSNLVSRATVKTVPYWQTLYDGFINGDYDIISVPRQYCEQLEGAPGVRCIKDLPVLSCNAFLFTFNINTTSPYMGVPGGLPLGTFNETGIPPDFFFDVDVRKGFAYCFNWTKYIEHESTFKGEAIQLASPVIEGLPYRNPDQEEYSFNLTEAETCLKRAWGGEVWNKGFSMTLASDVGSVPRLPWIEVLKEGVESLNPKFHIGMTEVIWPTYWEQMAHSELPIFYIGWLVDYPDPHNLVYTFMHSESALPRWQSYWNETVNDLIEAGLRATNTTRRREIYYELQNIYHDDCPSLPFQLLNRHWERDWVQGWYYNPIYPGTYFYHLWKQKMGYVDGWAVLLEMNEFPEGWSDIPVDFIDSERMQTALFSLGWQSDHMYIIHGNLTISVVQEAVEWLVNNTDHDDIALLYIFTHGMWMYNVLLWNDWFPDEWQKLNTSKKILMVDTCLAEEFIDSIKDDPSPHISLACCSAGEVSWAGLEEEGLPIIGSVWNYYFTNALCNASADLDSNGFISIEEAFNFSTPLVQRYMNETVFAVPEFLESYHDIGIYPENYDAYPHPVMDDGYPGQLVIPEFPSIIIMPLFMMATLLAVIFYRRKPCSAKKD